MHIIVALLLCFFPPKSLNALTLSKESQAPNYMYNTKQWFQKLALQCNINQFYKSLNDYLCIVRFYICKGIQASIRNKLHTQMYQFNKKKKTQLYLLFYEFYCKKRLDINNINKNDHKSLVCDTKVQYVIQKSSM